jgi:hypothetical protein
MIPLFLFAAVLNAASLDTVLSALDKSAETFK